MSEKCADFDYSRELAGDWSSRLMQLKHEGYTVLRSRVFWGSHESLPGVRDFARMSRLRLERFLALAEEHSFHVDLVCGFSFEAECYPKWSFSLPRQALVPLSLAPGEEFDFSLLRLPSLKNETIKEAFFEFIDEISAIGSLYAEPEGPLRSLLIDFTSESLDTEAADSDEFVEALTARYPTIEHLNLTYGTAFRSFDNFGSPQGFRVLMDKRPWLACFDYKEARRRRILALFSKISHRESVQKLKARLSLQLAEELPPDQENEVPQPTIFCDEASFERVGSRAAPLSPGRIPVPFSIMGARLANIVYERARNHGFRVLLGKEISKGVTQGKKSLLVVLSGRYLSRADHEGLSTYLEAGGNVFFPLQVPHYDEFLVAHHYTPSQSSEPRLYNGALFQRWSQNKGAVWVTKAPEFLGESLWDHVVYGSCQIQEWLCE